MLDFVDEMLGGFSYLVGQLFEFVEKLFGARAGRYLAGRPVFF
ncbi:MAG TPA: hypothetical protein VG845_11285 [Dehalococcoidia bacterium]|nr:hypothetical protein [Dehalococcoidia bacterium]